MGIDTQEKRRHSIKVFKHLIDCQLNEINQAKKQLIQTYRLENQDQNQIVWHPENCQNFNQFLDNLFDIFLHYCPKISYLKLSSLQSQNLAQRVIVKVLNNENEIRLTTGANLNQPSISVFNFFRARGLKAHYFLSEDEKYKDNQLTNQSVFNQINQSYELELKKQNFLDDISLIRLLIDQFNPNWIEKNRIKLFHHKPTPLETRLFEKLSIEPIGSGINFQKNQYQNSGSQPSIYQLKTKEDEFEHLIRKLKSDLLNQSNQGIDNGLIICAFHKKSSYKAFIDKASMQSDINFLDFDLNDSFIEFKEFHDAVILLQLFVEGSTVLKHLITSLSSMSFFYDLFNQQKLLTKLKRIRTQRIESKDLINLIQPFDSEFAKALFDFEKKINSKEAQRKHYSEFAKIASDFLYHLKWQVIKSNQSNIELANKTATLWQYLHQILDELSTLDLFKKQVTSDEFLQGFIDLLKSKSRARILKITPIVLIDYKQIAYLSDENLESISSIYLIGMDESFSKLVQLSHFLDSIEQKEKIDDMSALSSHHSICSELIHIAPKIKWISFTQIDNEITHEISPIILSCFENSKIKVLDTTVKTNQPIGPNQQDLSFFKVDSINEHLDSFSQTSVTKLNRYHQCNFLGFAESVLNQDNDEIQSEPQAKEKGVLLHQCLEFFFTKIKNFKDLLEAKKNNQLQSIKIDAIDGAIKRIVGYSHYYLEIEKQSLENLLDCFIDDLLTNPKNLGFQVLETEKKIELKINDFNLTGKIDAIEKKSTIVSLVDFKTSAKNSLNDSLQLIFYYWMMNRIDYPNTSQTKDQTSPPTKINHACYRHLFFKEAKPKVENTELNRDKLNSFVGLIEEFVQSYQAGHLAIRYDSQVCNNCQFRSLCRIDERTYY